MRLIGLLPVRNEEYCLGLSLRVALLFCDSVVVLLHACEDGSAEIVEQVIRENDRGRVIVIHKGNPNWHEMKHREEMLEAARRNGATHVGIVDADEIISANIVGSIRGHIEALSPGQILQLPGYNLRGSINRYHSNGIWGHRWFSFAFLDNKLAHWGGDTFHAREPRGIIWNPYLPYGQGKGGLLHLWAASERRLRAKHCWYRMTEVVRWPEKPVQIIDRLYSFATDGDPSNPSYGTPETWTYETVPAAWVEEYIWRGWMKHLNLDAVPWQEEHCRRMIEKHGREKFAGLNLLGVV